MWLNLLLLLLLFYLIKYSESSAEGNSLISVTGKKGENATLQCKSEDREIQSARIVLNRLSKNILDCQNEECDSKNDRVFKEGSCDVIITDLIYSDAGKYILNVYYTNDQTEVEYHLHIHGEISVKKGKDLKLDVLLINADKVERNSSSGWTELWTRGHGVNGDRLFTVTDTGTYRVLDYKGETLITVTVTGTNLNMTDDYHKTNDTEQNKALITGLSVSGVLLVLAGIIFAFYKIYQHQHRNTDHDPVPMEDIEH